MPYFQIRHREADALQKHKQLIYFTGMELRPVPIDNDWSPLILILNKPFNFGAGMIKSRVALNFWLA